MSNSTESYATESYTAVAGQARQATEKSVEAFKNGAQALTRQFDAVKLPEVDLTQPVTRYFEFLQKAIDVNRDFAIQWAEMFTNLSSSVREQAQQVGGLVKDQADTVADLTTEQAEKAEQATREQADKVEQAKREQAEKAEQADREEAEEAEESEKAKAREAKRVEREEARKAQQQAREAYEGLSKAELADQLAGRGLPKTGNIDDLIERLVSADSE